MKARGGVPGARGRNGADGDEGPGVPEALPRILIQVGERLGVTTLDRLWIFPPLVQGRREWGLVAASRFDGDDARRLVTARYRALRTGKGLYLDTRLTDEGVAPPGHLDRVMEGVARRGPQPLGHARAIEVAGHAEAFQSLMGQFDENLLVEPASAWRDPVVPGR